MRPVCLCVLLAMARLASPSEAAAGTIQAVMPQEAAPFAVLDPEAHAAPIGAPDAQGAFPVATVALFQAAAPASGLAPDWAWQGVTAVFDPATPWPMGAIPRPDGGGGVKLARVPLPAGVFGLMLGVLALVHVNLMRRAAGRAQARPLARDPDRAAPAWSPAVGLSPTGPRSGCGRPFPESPSSSARIDPARPAAPGPWS